MNNAHIPPVRSLLDPRPPVAWPDTTEVLCMVDMQKHLFSNIPQL